MKIPSSLVPRCPVCGAPMVPNLRVDDAFVEDEGWRAAARRYEKFIGKIDSNTVLLELGVGANTPGIIKYPFRAMAREYGTAYICVNKGESFAPQEISDRSVLCVDGDISAVI